MKIPRYISSKSGLCQLFLLILFFMSLQVNAQRIASSGGTYTINPGGSNTGSNFTSFTHAINDLNQVGTFTGNIILNVSAGGTFTELPPVITATGNTGATITFIKSGAGTNPVIVAAGNTLSQADAAITIRGGDYFTFNGIDVTAADSSLEYGFLLRKADAANGVRNNVITNCTILMHKLKSNTYAVLQTADSIVGTSPVAYSSSLQTNNNNSYTQLVIGNSFNGICLKGFENASYRDSNNIVNNNTVGRSMINDMGADGINQNAFGINLTWQYQAQLNNNTVQNLSLLNLPGTAVTLSAIAHANGLAGTISNNSISKIETSKTVGNNAVMNTYGINGATLNGVYISGNTISTINTNLYIAVYSSGTNTNVKVMNNMVSNCSGNGEANGIYMTSATGCRVSGNTISGISTTATSQLYSIRITGGANDSLDNNIIRNISATSYVQGIYTATTNNFRIYNNVIENLSGTSNVYGINVNTMNTNSRVYDNTINNLVTTGSTSTVYGMYSAQLSGTTYLYSNKITNIEAGLTGTSTSIGWYVTTLTSGTIQVNFYNNIINGVKKTYTGAAIATRFATAIYLATTTGAGTTYNIIHNAVSIDGSNSPNASTQVLFNSATNASTAPVIVLRNNIFVNATIAQSGVAKHYIIYASGLSGIFGNGNSSSNYNCFYVPYTNNGFVGYSGADLATLSNWRTSFPSHDVNTINSNPIFNTVENLRIMPGSPAIKTGTFVSGFITDILGLGRHASTPSMGPYEQAMDVTKPTITYAKAPHQFYPQNYVLDSFAVITDAANGAINTNFNTAPRIYYKLKQHSNVFGVNAQNADGWKYTDATNTTSPFSFTISYSLLYGGVVNVGDTVQYFIVAQDTAGIPNVQANPSAGFSGTAVDAITAAPAQPAFYTVLSNPSALMGSDVIHASLSKVGQGTSNNAILRIKVTTDLNGTSAYVSKLDFNTHGGGNDSANIESASVFYTGASDVFSTSDLFGSITFTPATAGTIGAFSIKGNSLTTNGDNYFWLVYKIRQNAVMGDEVDAELTGFTYSGTHEPYNGGAIAGNREIRAEYCLSSAYVPTLEDIGQITLKQNGNTIFTSPGNCNTFNSTSANKQYTDNTSLPLIGMKQNSAVSFSACVTTSSAFFFGSYLTIFIDYNQNGIWGSDELAYASKGININDTTFKGTFTIPCSAKLGETRMRVVLRALNSLTYSAGIADACYSNNSASYNYGETEDYLVNILPNAVSYLSSTAIQQTGVVGAGLHDQSVLRIPVVADGCGVGTVNEFYFNTAGSTSTMDLNSAKIYSTGNSPLFNTSKLVTSQFGPAGSFVFTGFTDTLLTATNDTNNYWLAYDISISAPDHNVVDAVLDSIGLLGAYRLPAIGNPAGNRPVLAPMQYISSEAIQTNTNKVNLGTIQANVIGLRVIGTATGAPLAVTSMSLNTNGTTALSDILNIKVWYSGNERNFSTAKQFGTTVITPAATHTISGHQLLANDTSYFWVTYDIPVTATLNNFIDAEIVSLTVNGTQQVPTVLAPTGNRQIIKAYCPSVPSFPFRPDFASTNEDIGNVTFLQNGTTILNNGTGCTPVENNTSASGTYTDYTSLATGTNIRQNDPVSFSLCAISSAGMSGAAAVIYIDYNQDGDFDTTERAYVSSNTTYENTTFSGKFTVPCTAQLGSTRMRIILGPNLLPCSNGSYFYGETEDYMVNIVSNPARYISSTAVQNSSNVPPGATNAPILRIPVVAAGCGDAIVTEFKFSTSGTTSAGDIASAKLYVTGNSAIFNTGKLLASKSNPSGSFSFYISDTLQTKPGDTNNYWLTYDIASPATLANRVDAVFDGIEAVGTLYAPIVSDPAGSRLIDQPMLYVSSTTAQTLLSRVETGSVNNHILGLRVVASASGSPIDLTAIEVSANGTTQLSDISNLKIWYTGTNATFDTLTRFGSTVAAPAATQTISQIQALAHGTNYFWITYDIPSGGTLSNAVDAEIGSIIIDGSTHVPSVTAPAGVRLIKAPYCVSGSTNEFAAGEDIGQFTLTQKGVSLLSNGSCMPATNNSSANKSYTDYSTSIAPIQLAKNTTVDFSLCAIKPGTISYNCYAAIFIDYNHNGLWENGELVYASPATTNNGATFTGSFAVPCNATNGETRMRVMLISTNPPTLSSACNATIVNYNYGETEDYTVNIKETPVAYTTSTAIQNAGNVAPGTTDAQLLRIPVIANGCGTAEANGFYFNTSGTSAASDIASAKLYSTGTSSAFNASKLIGTVSSPSGAFSFTGLNDLLNTNATDTTNYWLVYDVSSSAVLGNAIDARIDSIRIQGTGYVPVITNPAGSRSIVQPMTYVSAAVTQQNMSRIETGFSKANILGLQVVTSNTGSPVLLSSVDVSTAGTTSLTDVTNIRIWYTGISNKFATHTQFGSAITTPALQQVINGSQLLQNGTNYFWITYDIAANATVGNVVDGEIVSLVFNGSSQLLSATGVAGSREISIPYCQSVATSTMNEDIGNVTLSDGVNTLMNNGDAAPATNNVNANGQYTNFVESVPAASIMQGRSYSVSVTSIFSAGLFNSTRSVYIDYNNDGDFADADELAWTSVPSLSSATTTGSFIVPLTATPGTTRMRVILIQGSTPSSASGACVSYTYGETEDYAISILPAAQAAAYTWNVTSASGAFGTASNWTPVRTFPAVTDILFVNNGGNKTITGIPAQQVRSLYVSNNTTLTLSGTSALTVSDSLEIASGSRINTGSMTLVLGTDSNVTGSFAGSGTYSGTFRRWVNSGTASYAFPLMMGNNKKAVSITYTVPPVIAGTITVNFTTGNPGSAGLPLNDASLLHTIENISKEGVWNVSAGNGMTDGTYDILIESDNTPGITDVNGTSLVYRGSALNSWSIPGTAWYASGSTASVQINRNGITGYGQFTIGGTSANPLPVKLLSFTATKINKNVNLAWTTATEMNNKGFEVQRSTDGNMFETIGFVKANGNTGSINTYRFSDTWALSQAITYYRLKQLDHNNNFEYSNLAIIRQEALTQAPSFTLFPNPFTSRLMMKVEAMHATEGNMEVYDITGKRLLNEQVQLEEGGSLLPVSGVDTLPRGVYVVILTIEGERQFSKVVKQ